MHASDYTTHAHNNCRCEERHAPLFVVKIHDCGHREKYCRVCRRKRPRIIGIKPSIGEQCMPREHKKRPRSVIQSMNEFDYAKPCNYYGERNSPSDIPPFALRMYVNKEKV